MDERRERAKAKMLELLAALPAQLEDGTDLELSYSGSHAVLVDVRLPEVIVSIGLAHRGLDFVVKVSGGGSHLTGEGQHRWMRLETATSSSVAAKIQEVLRLIREQVQRRREASAAADRIRAEIEAALGAPLRLEQGTGPHRDHCHVAGEWRNTTEAWRFAITSVRWGGLSAEQVQAVHRVLRGEVPIEWAIAERLFAPATLVQLEEEVR